MIRKIKRGLKKNRKKLLISLLLIFGFVFTRLSSILTIPFFQDEADYIYFAIQAMSQKGMGFISLSQGVKPMHTWLMIPFLMVIKDPVMGARLLSMTTGLFSMVGVYLLSCELFGKKKIGIIAATIFILFPYAQIYNSLAVLESSVSVFIIFSIYFLVKLFRNPNLANAYAYGIITGLGLLTKRQAFFNIYLIPLFFFILPQKIRLNSRLIKLLSLLVFAVVITYAMQLILKNSEFYERIAWFEGGNIYTKKAWIVLPFQMKLHIFQTNILNTALFTLSYVTFPYVALLIYGIAKARKNMKSIIILLSFFLLPILTICIFGRWVGERWLYPTSITIIPIVAYGLYTFTENFSKKKFFGLKKNVREICIYALFFTYPSYFILSTVFFPLNSPMTTNEKSQYFMCPTTFFEREAYYFKVFAKNKKVIIGTQNELGFVNIMRIDLKGEKNITINGYFPKKNKLPNELVATTSAKVFYATYLGSKDEIKDQRALKIKEEGSQKSLCTYRLYEVVR